MWRARPVFISSTFADMQAERDHLRNHVFLELEERLRKRRHTLEWVDLRMGVATASLAEGEARELQVLKVCLAEVKRCRPFLIVLLGDRYGWVPPAERITAAANEEGFGVDVAGRSVTDLEISFGVLDDPDQQPHSFFYLRDPLPYADMPPDLAALHADAFAQDPLAAARVERLTALKQRITASLPNRVRRYAVGWDRERQRVTGLEDWGRQVLEDIWAELEAETASSAAAPEPSWSQMERDALDDYVEDRARGFVGRQTILTQLLQHAASSARDGASWGVCLTGDPGSGKSAIFGELLRQLRATDAFLLAHAAGASPRAPSVESMLRRWIEELATALGVDAGLAENADPDTIGATFRALLARMAAQRRVVLAVDALDQFEGTTQGRHVTWLPHPLPANARFIATAVPGEASEALRQRPGVQLQSLAPLDGTEANRIAEAICARYHRTLEPDVLNALLAKRGADGPAWGNPLWLVLAVEELNLLDADDFARATRSYAGAPAEQLRALMLDIVGELPADIPGLYRASFERAEQQFGMFPARAFIGFIAVSRAGWRETDFRSLLPRASGEPWDELRFASLRRLFRGQLRQVGSSGQWDFAHAQMRSAARRYLAALSVSEAEFHAEASEHLLQLPREDPLRQTEAMVHLLGSEDWAKAARFYGDPALTAPELDGAAQVLADGLLSTEEAALGLASVQHLLDALAGDPAADSITGLVAERLVFDLDQKISTRASLQVQEGLHRRVERSFDRLAKADPGNAGWQRDLSVSHDRIGDVQSAQGNLPAALAAFQASHNIFDRLAKADPGNAGWQRDLSVSHNKIGDVQSAQGNLPAALAAFQASLAIADRLAKADPGNAGWQFDLGISHERIGTVLQAQGNLTGALTEFETKRHIISRLAKADPGNAGWQADLAASYGKLGQLYSAMGRHQEALETFKRGRGIIAPMVGRSPDVALWKQYLANFDRAIASLGR